LADVPVPVELAAVDDAPTIVDDTAFAPEDELAVLPLVAVLAPVPVVDLVPVDDDAVVLAVVVQVLEVVTGFPDIVPELLTVPPQLLTIAPGFDIVPVLLM